MLARLTSYMKILFAIAKLVAAAEHKAIGSLLIVQHSLLFFTLY